MTSDELKSKVKRNRYFEEIALDMLDFCGGAISLEAVQKFWQRETERKSLLTDMSKLRILQIAIRYQLNP